VDTELEVAEPFLHRRGFAETEREQTSVLTLPGNGMDRLDELREELRRQGIETAAFSEIDSEASRRSLYQTACAVQHDMPTTEEWDDPSVETFLRNWFAAPGARREAIFVALEGATVVGISSILLRADGDAEVGITGVLNSHRRRGIARVLKLMVSRYAVEHRIPRIHTDNNAVNAAMLALNRALGFRPRTVIITFERRLHTT
jgi:RimJ/RimL family protein N-acetyltransferase